MKILLYFFPVAMMIMSVCASIIFLFFGDKPRALYYISGALIICSTLIMK